MMLFFAQIFRWPMMILGWILIVGFGLLYIGDYFACVYHFGHWFGFFAGLLLSPIGLVLYPLWLIFVGHWADLFQFLVLGATATFVGGMATVLDNIVTAGKESK